MPYHYEKYFNIILTILNELTSFNYVFTQSIEMFKLLDAKNIVQF